MKFWFANILVNFLALGAILTACQNPFGSSGKVPANFNSVGGCTRYADMVMQDSPVAYWRLGESVGTAAIDERGTNPGTYSGAFVLGTSGALPSSNGNSAASFSTNASIAVADSASLKPAQITVEAWVNPTGLSGWVGLVMKASSGAWNDGYGLFHDNSDGNFLRFYINNYATNFVRINVATGQWQHIVAIYDLNTIQIYLNGVAGTPFAFTSAIGHTSNTLLIGQGTGGYYYNGALDEVAIYSTALSPTRILAHYNAATCP